MEVYMLTSSLLLLLTFVHVDTSRLALRSEIDHSQNWLLGFNPECNFKCERTRRRKFCGSNGRTYKTVCEEKRAKCLDPMLKTKRGRCKEAVCFQARSHALLKIKADSKESAYVPNCTADGNYAPQQCNLAFHTCWCVTPDGRLVEGSVVENGESSCNGGGNVRRSTETCTASKRATLPANVRGRIMRDYRKATPRSEVTIGNELLLLALRWEFANVDKNKDDSINPREVRVFLKKLHARECVSAFSNLCDDNQDNGINSTEWMSCLFTPLTLPTKKEDSKELSTTPTTDILSAHKNTVNSVLSAQCPRGQHASLVTKIRKWLVKQAKRSGTNPPTRTPATSNDDDESTISSAFSRYDKDGNGNLSSREMKRMRRRFRKDKFKECFLFVCDKNGDGNLSEKEFTNCLASSRKSNCAKEKREAMQSQQAQTSIYVPNCETEGSRFFNSIQCHAATGYCWCASRDTGRPIPGTSIRGGNPDCEKPPPPTTGTVITIPGCSKPEAFMASLHKAIVRKMARQYRNDDTNTTSVPSSLNGEVAIWLYQTLDVNSDNQVNKREAKAFRKLVRRRVAPKKCLKNFMRFCDENENKKVTQDEFRTCLQVVSE